MFTEKSINPTRPCRIILFNIGNSLAERKDEYEATRSAWVISEKHRNIFEYEFVVGLEKGISKGSYKIKRWTFCEDSKNRYEFEGDEIPDFTGFTWYKQIDHGFWKFGAYFVIEFDGNGKFRRIRPHQDQWFDC